MRRPAVVLVLSVAIAGCGSSVSYGQRLTTAVETALKHTHAGNVLAALSQQRVIGLLNGRRASSTVVAGKLEADLWAEGMDVQPEHLYEPWVAQSGVALLTALPIQVRAGAWPEMSMKVLQWGDEQRLDYGATTAVLAALADAVK